MGRCPFGKGKVLCIYHSNLDEFYMKRLESDLTSSSGWSAVNAEDKIVHGSSSIC